MKYPVKLVCKLWYYVSWWLLYLNYLLPNYLLSHFFLINYGWLTYSLTYLILTYILFNTRIVFLSFLFTNQNIGKTECLQQSFFVSFAFQFLQYSWISSSSFSLIISVWCNLLKFTQITFSLLDKLALSFTWPNDSFWKKLAMITQNKNKVLFSRLTFRVRGDKKIKFQWTNRRRKRNQMVALTYKSIKHTQLSTALY